MTQIFGSLAYCQEEQFTLFISDRQVTPVVQIAPDFYGHPVGADFTYTTKVHATAHSAFGIGGYGAPVYFDGTLVNRLQRAPEGEEQYKLFKQFLQEQTQGGQENNYIFAMLAKRPRFMIGRIRQGTIVLEMEADTCSVHRGKVAEELKDQDLSPWHTKFWFEPDYLKRTLYEKAATAHDGSYAPTIDLMTQLIVREMYQESKNYSYGVSKEWDTFLFLGERCIHTQTYSMGLHHPIAFLENAIKDVETPANQLTPEQNLRLAYGGISLLSLETYLHSTVGKVFPYHTHARAADVVKVFDELVLERRTLPRRELLPADFERYTAFIKALRGTIEERKKNGAWHDST